MHQRQRRITGTGQISLHLAELVGKKINIVLNDNTVVFGELVRIQPDSICMLNMRLRKMEIPMDHSYEIYQDVNA